MQTGKSISELINEASDKKVILIICEGENLELEKETHRAIRYVMDKAHIPFEHIGVINVGMKAHEFVRLPEIRGKENLVVVVNENTFDKLGAENSFEKQATERMREIMSTIKLTAPPELPMIDLILENPLGSKNAKTKRLPPPSVKKGHVKPKFTLRGRHR